MFTKPEQKLFWSRVSIGGPDDCWEWKLRPSQDGYGIFCIPTRRKRGRGQKYRRVKAHRYAKMIQLQTKLPPEIKVLHSCDNPPCCNPDHLFTGSQIDNIMDMVRKGRQNAPRGERNNLSKRTVEEVLEIRRLRREGMSCAEIAVIFNTDRTSVWSIDKRRCWKHLP
jgi:hypothetical protein